MERPRPAGGAFPNFDTTRNAKALAAAAWVFWNHWITMKNDFAAVQNLFRMQCDIV